MSSQGDFHDREYNPRHSVSDPAALFAAWRARGDTAAVGLRGHVDLAYGDGLRERLDLYPAAPGAPLLVFIHGGFWRFCSKEDFLWIAPPFVAAGVSVAMIEYALAPTVSLTDIHRQTVKAMGWLHTHLADFGLAPGRTVVAGHSAGGQLATLLACEDTGALASDLPAGRIHSVVSVSGVHDLHPIQQTPYLQADLHITDAEVAAWSPARRTPRPGVPVLTAVGESESSEFKRQARLLRECWGDAASEPMVIAGAHHYAACEALGDPAQPLFRAVLAQCGK